MASTPDAQLATMVANLAANTGRTIDEWAALVHASGAAKHGEMVAWLKREHGLTHGYANLIAHHAPSGAPADTWAAVDAMLAGKESLRPVVDAVLAAVRSLGPDVEEAPKKGYLSLRRATQFATVHPSTKTRVDLGLKLRGVEPGGRLEAAGSWNAMVTHRVRLEDATGVDGAVRAWLARAYEGAA